MRPFFALILREWRTSWADRGAYVLRTCYAGALFAAAVVAWFVLPLAQSDRTENLPGLVRSIFAIFGKLQFALATLMASMTFARSVSREQERGSLDLLLLTPLTRTQLLLGKLIGEFLGMTALLACGVPVIFLLLPLGGLNPLQILAVHLILAAQVLLVGALSVGLSAVFARALSVMSCVWLLIGALVAGPIWINLARTRKTWIWELWDRLSPYEGLDRQLSGVRPDLAACGWMLLAAALLGLLCCGLGSLVLERRIRKGSTVSLWVRLGRPIRDFAATVRGRSLFRPLAALEHPLMRREFAVYRDLPFRISWILLMLTYGVAMGRLYSDERTREQDVVMFAGGALLAGAVLSILMGALSVGYDRLRGRLLTLVAAGVAAEDIVRARLAGLLVRMLYLIAVPALHLALTAVWYRWFPPSELAWRIPAAFLALILASMLAMDMTLNNALKSRRPEAGAVGALLWALPTGLLVISIAYTVPGLAIGLPLTVAWLFAAYARSIRNLPKWVLK